MATDDKLITVTTKACPACGHSEAVKITSVESFALNAGAPMQDVFPERDADFREMFITGYDKKCWDELFDF